MTSAPPPPPAPPAEPPSWAPPPADPAGPAGPAARPPLQRSAGNKMLGGVCGGLAEYSGVDALLWRVGFVALALAGGTGVLVYLLLWLLMPAGPAGQGGSGTPAWTRDWRRAERPLAGPRSPVAGITIAGLLIVVGVLVLVTRLTSWDFGVRGFLGVALLVVGLGLVGAAFSSGRVAKGGLIFLGVILSLALLAASTGPWNFRGGVGDRDYRPASAAAVRPVYDAGFGNTTVDLTRIDLSDVTSPIHTKVDGGVGNLRVIVPATADVQLTLDDGIGHTDIFGSGSTDGYFAGQGAAWSDDGNPEFDLTIDAGIGNVEVSRG